MIENEEITYIDNSPLGVRLYRAVHSTPHMHPDALELLYCLEGSVDLVSGYEQVSLSRGDVFSVDNEDVHCVYSDKPNLILSLYLDLTKMKDGYDYLTHIYFSCESPRLHSFQKQPMERLKDILLATAYLAMSEDGGGVGGSAPEAAVSPQVYQDVAEDIMTLLLHYFDWFNFINDPSYANTWLQERFYRISSYCQENYMNKITIAEMARMEFVNPNYFSQFFRNTIFGGFNVMLNFIRCFSAEHLLLTTELPVSEISARCGFSDPKYFYKHFKRWWGRTPQQHRIWYKNYMKQAPDLFDLPAEESFEFLEKYMAARQAEKMIRGEI